MHTFKTTGKSYIGYTNLTVAQRLHKHYTNSMSGIDTHFYKAIRKYGIEDVETSILDECETNAEARDLEIENISKYDTFNNGYNLTKGGDGGDIANQLTGDRLKKYRKLRSEVTTGDKNPNHSGFSDDDLIRYAVEFYEGDNLFTLNSWKRHAKKNGLPQHFSKNRFKGSFNHFRILVLDELQKGGRNIVMDDLEYKITESHKNKLAKASGDWRWFTDGTENIRVHKDNVSGLDAKFKKGRVL